MQPHSPSRPRSPRGSCSWEHSDFEPVSSPWQGATNFAVVSTGATSVALVLFCEDDLEAGRVTHEIPLDPQLNRTGNVWHIALPALDDSLLYGEPQLSSPMCPKPALSACLALL